MSAKPKLHNDLTEGSVLPKLLRFAAPLVLTSLLQTLYSLVDTVVAGRVVGNSAISAITNAGQVVNMVTMISLGLSIGGNVLLSHYYGSREETERKKATGTLFVFVMLLGLVASALLFFLTEPIMTALKAPAYAESCRYLRICSVGVFISYGYNALSAIIRAGGNSRQPLYFIGAATVINIGLDIWFVSGFGWGVAGTAYATVIAQVVTFVCALVFVLMHREFYGFKAEYMRIYPEKLKKTLKVGVPSALQSIIGSISWTVVLVFINKYDVDVSAAAGAANKLREVFLLCISSLAMGTGTMIAQCLGAGKYDRAKKTLNTALAVNLVQAAVIIAVLEIFARPLVSIFTHDETAINYAVRHLRIESISFIFYAGFMTYNAMATGAGHTLFVMFNSFVNCILVRIVLVIILEGAMGLKGIYWACAFAPAVSVPIGWLYLRSNKWRKTGL